MMNENNAIDEGLFKTLGGWADKGAALGARGANAAVSGLGQGVMQGVKRGFEVAKQGNAANQIANMRAKMEKAINSGDPKQFATVAKEIHAELKAIKKRMPVAPTDKQQQARKPNRFRGSSVQADLASAAPKAPVAANITPNASPSQQAANA